MTQPEQEVDTSLKGLQDNTQALQDAQLCIIQNL